MLNSFGDEYKPNKFIMPVSSQNKFNKSLSLIAAKYLHQHRRYLISLTCSEFLASSLFCLSKDHKRGPFKESPVVVAVDTTGTKLSIQFSTILNCLPHHTQAHLLSSSSFMESITHLLISQDCLIATLNVTKDDFKFLLKQCLIRDTISINGKAHNQAS